MTSSTIRLLPVVLALVVGSALQAEEKKPQLAHMVFFRLKERTAAGRDALVAACDEYLSKHEGTVYYSAGVLAEDLNRDVNDREFDVALHIVFRDSAAHAKYQTHPRHLEFIEKCKESWESVRVFDSYVRPRIGKSSKPKKPDPNSGADGNAGVRRVPLPDRAASFAGMIEGIVVGKRKQAVVVKVSRVVEEWKHSKAESGADLVGQRVLIRAGKNDNATRFLALLKKGESASFDVAHRQGEALLLLELTEEQRARVAKSND